MLRFFAKFPPGGYCLLRIAKEELSLSKERSRFRMCRSFIASQDGILREADQESTGKYRDTQSPTPHA